MRRPKNFCPNVNKLRIGTSNDPGPINVPDRNAQEHKAKGSINRIGPILGIDKTSHKETSYGGEYRGEGMKVHFIFPSK